MFDAGERSTVTTSDGNPWSISGLTPADAGKKVHEVQQSGYVQTVGVGGVTIVNPGSGGEQTGIDFANVPVNPAEWSRSALVLNDFDWAHGWDNPNTFRQLTDLDQNGAVDYLGFGNTQTFGAFGGTWPSGPGFAGFTALLNDLGVAQGFTQAHQRGAANAGYGLAEIIYGQGDNGIVWYGATQTEIRSIEGQPTPVPVYEASPHLYANFGIDQGWTVHHSFDIVKASTADSFASILGFGNSGIVVGPDAFAPGADASQSYTIALPVGNDHGWDQSLDVRAFESHEHPAIDLNTDGIADFVGMGPNGLQFATGFLDGGGNFQLNALQTAHINGGSSDFGRAQGWNNGNTIRYIADLNGDGRQDILGFGNAGALVSLGQDPTTHGGEAFGQIYLGIADFGFAQGWLSPTDLPRVIGDVNGDNVLDIVGFGNSNTFTALGSTDVNGPVTWAIDPTLTINDYGAAQGWNSAPTVRDLADIDGDGKAELVLSGAQGTHTWDLVLDRRRACTEGAFQSPVLAQTGPNSMSAPMLLLEE